MPTALWRRCVMLVLRWLLLVNVLLLGHVCFRILQPMEALGRQADVLRYGRELRVFNGMSHYLTEPADGGSSCASAVRLTVGPRQAAEKG